jgi:arginine/lysine/ornithine decarboxylase
MSDALLYQALRKRAAEKAARFHMPGHKGRAAYELPSNPFSIDYTEIDGTGNLYEGDEPIFSAEQHAARVLGAADCLFLTGGSTLALQTAIAAAVPAGGSLLLDRNCHKAVTHAMALLDLTPHFVCPQPLPSGISGLLSPDDVEQALRQHPEASALLVTSPNYYGVLQDIPTLAALCHRYGKLLLVDAAHGAHLRAVCGQSVIEQGADLAAVSTHKTLPALGQSAALLSSGRIPFSALLQTAPLFGTSSPSYLLMSSIDLACCWLEDEGTEAFRACADTVQTLRRTISQDTPFTALTEQEAPLDPCRLTISCRGTNVTGNELNAILCREFGIDAEMADEHHVVFICTGMDQPRDYARLMGALKHPQFFQTEAGALPVLPPLPAPHRVCSVRQAQFSPFREIPVEQAAGRICARAVTPYPPGVPVIYPGEQIDQVHIEFLLHECYTKISVVCVIDECTH